MNKITRLIYIIGMYISILIAGMVALISFAFPKLFIEIEGVDFDYKNGIVYINSITDEEVYIGKNVEKISFSEKYIESTNIITKITVSEENRNYYVKNGFLYAGTTLLLGTNISELKVNNEKIGDYAFSGCDLLKKVTFLDDVINIGNYAFANCVSLTEVIIPENVKNIGFCAFLNAEFLTIYTKYLSIPKEWHRGWNFSNCQVIYGYQEYVITFEENGGSLVEDITMLEGTFIELPKPTKENFVFVGWYLDEKLTTKYDEQLQVKASFTLYAKWIELKIGTDGIVYELNKDGDSYNVSNYNGTASDVIISSVHLGLPVTSIGEYAFSGCTSLTSIEIPNSVTSIGEWSFSGCGSLTSVTIPNSVTSIGADAFYYCNSLTSIEIPNSVTSIGEYAFSGCRSLTSIEIPNSVTSIGEYAFSGCRSLTSIEIPNSVTSIGRYAFSGCTSLTSIEIPNSVTSIGEGAFVGCYSLTIYCEVSSCPRRWHIDWNFDNQPVIWGCNITEELEYELSRDKKYYIVTDIGTCTDTDIVIPSVYNDLPVKELGDYAFFNCKSLTSIEIPSSVTSIGEWSFSGCDSLTSIEIPSSVTSIGKNAFRYCSNLTIYCEATSLPDGWHIDWNFDNRPVVWGYTE